MLKHPTYDRLIALGLTGMARALEEQRSQPDVSALTFEERLALLVDREAAERHNKRLANRLKFAGLRHNAVVEDIDVKTTRGLDRALLQKLIAGDWIDRKLNLIIIGPTGIGKSFLACALGHKACRDDRSVLYQRMPRLLGALALARGDGRHVRLLRTFSRVDLLILDDWGLAPLTPSRATTFSKSSMTGTIAIPPSSPASCRSSTGTRQSRTRRSQMQSSTASSIARTGCNWTGPRCANSKPPLLRQTFMRRQAGTLRKAISKPPAQRHPPSRKPSPSRLTSQQKVHADDRRAQPPGRPGGSTGTSRARRRVSLRARRDARGSLLLTTGTASHPAQPAPAIDASPAS